MQMRKPLVMIALSLALSAGPALAQQDIDKVFGGITAEAGEEYGSLSSVNGGITIRAGATVAEASTVNGGISVAAKARIESAETVNGGIKLGEEARAGSLETVNGGIRLAPGAAVEQDVSTVNGGIRLGKDVQVAGDASTVNGAIELEGAEVGGRVSTTNGDITLSEAASIRGGILVEKPSRGWFNSNKSRTPRIVIGAGSVVEGTLVFEREVELFVHATARIGEVTGATAQSFTGEAPPRS